MLEPRSYSYGNVEQPESKVSTYAKVLKCQPLWGLHAVFLEAYRPRKAFQICWLLPNFTTAQKGYLDASFSFRLSLRYHLNLSDGIRRSPYRNTIHVFCYLSPPRGPLSSIGRQCLGRSLTSQSHSESFFALDAQPATGLSSLQERTEPSRMCSPTRICHGPAWETPDITWLVSSSMFPCSEMYTIMH